MKLIHLYRNVWKNYSLLRAYENEFVGTLRLAGRGIDLGAKSKDAKYYEFMDLSDVSQMDFVDFYHASDDVVQVNLEEPFAIADGRYDFILLFNVMEHIYNYRNVISESHRILRAGGQLHGIVPLMWQFHADPNDYFRFTWQALARILQETGWSGIVIKPLAFGPFKVAASQVGQVLRCRPLRLVLYASGMALDTMLRRFSSGSESYAMAYYFAGSKVES